MHGTCDSDGPSNGSFNEILPFRLSSGSHLDSRQREYGRSVDRRRPVGDKTSTGFFFAYCPYHSDSVIVRESTVRLTACSHPNPETLVARNGEWKAQGGVQRPALLKECQSDLRASVQRDDTSACLGEHRPSDLCTVKTANGGSIYGSRRKAEKAPLNKGAFLPRSTMPEAFQEPEELDLDLVWQGKRMCQRCGLNEVYQDIATMDWCEPCLWEFLNE